MTEEQDSQLSAMFDDELPQTECELLARRLARDEGLKQRWGRYAAMRACFREEGSARSVRIAAQVRSRLLIEADLEGAGPGASTRLPAPGFRRALWQPLASIAVACGVAAVSILWVRTRAPQPDRPVLQAHLGTLPTVTAATPLPTRSSGEAEVSDEPDSYVVPAATDAPTFAPTAELANYVVAHSEYSTPLNRRSLLSSFVSSEGVAAAVAGPAQPSDVARDRPNAER